MQKDNRTSSSADERFLQELSALMDGESNHAESVLEETTRNPDCRASWQSYHLIRDVMQSERQVPLPNNFASLISEKIAAEEDSLDVADPRANSRANPRSNPGAAEILPFARRPKTSSGAKSAPQSHTPPRWLPVAGLGLAASVAAAGFMGWQVLKTSQSTDVADTVTAQLSLPTDQPSDVYVPDDYQEETGTRWVAETGERNAMVESRLNSLLLAHLEDSSMSGVHGMVAHSRLVGYDTESVNNGF